jgi:hypothetical protein
MQVTLILLYGFLEIVAQGNSTPTRLGVEFNLVAWAQLSRPVRHLLQAAIPAPASAMDKTPYSAAAQQADNKLPLKFITKQGFTGSCLQSDWMNWFSNRPAVNAICLSFVGRF